MKKSISASSCSGYKLNNDSTRIESFPDSTRVLQMNISHYEDTLSQEVFISTAYEHIREVRDLIVNSRQSMKPLREAISQLRNQIQTVEHQQKKDQINLEYDISQSIHKLKQKINQFEIVQTGEFALLQEQIQKLQHDDQEIIQNIDTLELRIIDLAPQIGQYTYQEYQQ
ncbi:unnamed protein product [Paramecium sonneborni]|uniref:Uncharacterized protein n=1 Tax=Paramecium sonneborni TaxID=65129 RepID=A0A8S1MHR8_9CILI|nr:unnamed protein product [Paramecium sonneborni]